MADERAIEEDGKRNQTIEWLRGLAAKGGKGTVNNIDARSLGRIADDLEQLGSALKPFADAAPKDGEYLRPVRLVYDPSGDKGSLSPEDFLNARAALKA